MKSAAAGEKWCRENHFRFSWTDRRLVIELLLIQRRTGLIHKDVLISILIPMVIGPLVIPRIYISNLPFDLTDEDLGLELGGGPFELLEIARRRDQHRRSKGFAFFKWLKKDDHDRLFKGLFEIGGRTAVLMEALEGGN